MTATTRKTCRALVYHKRWPDSCSRTAIVRGYCTQHAKANPAPQFPTPAVRFHLTHTGVRAGLAMCGSTEHTPSDQHPSYTAAGLARQLANCCPACAQAWHAAASEYGADAVFVL